MKNGHSHKRKRERERRKQQRASLVAWFKKHKQSLRCKQCKLQHPAVIEFHHRDPTQKDFNISRAISRGYGKKRILDEIAKCDILCANCHRILHWEDR